MKEKRAYLNNPAHPIIHHVLASIKTALHQQLPSHRESLWMVLNHYNVAILNFAASYTLSNWQIAGI